MHVHAALFGVSLIYGANYSIAKIIVPEYITPSATIVFRVLISGAFFWIIHTTSIREKVTRSRDYYHLAACGFLGVAANQLMFFKGLSITTPINASLLMLTTPVLVFLLSYFFLKEKFTLRKATGIVLSGTGAVLLVGGTHFSFSSETVLGDLFIFLNALAYGSYLVLVKPLMAKYHTITIVKWTFFFAAFPVLFFGWEEAQQLPWEALPSIFYYCLAFIVLGTTIAAYLFNAWALKYVNASVVGAYIYLQPVLATIFAYIIRGDKLTLQTFALSLLIFTGVYLVSRK